MSAADFERWAAEGQTPDPGSILSSMERIAGLVAETTTVPDTRRLIRTSLLRLSLAAEGYHLSDDEIERVAAALESCP